MAGHVGVTKASGYQNAGWQSGPRRTGRPYAAVPHPDLPNVTMIPLSAGRFALVDNDFAFLAQWRWQASSNSGSGKPYARRTENIDGRQCNIYMHRVVCEVPQGAQVDHINGDRLDNRRCNLRPCSAAENSRNSQFKPAGALGFRGVERQGNRFYARLLFEGRTVRAGAFATAEEAARAHDEAAKRFHGAFAVLNFPDEAERVA